MNETAQEEDFTSVSVVEEPIPSILLPCASCNRTFRPEALAKHLKVCETTLMKKRKKFDSAKQRIQGTELAHFNMPHGMNGKKAISRVESQSRWKEKDKGSNECSRSGSIRKTSVRKSDDRYNPDHEQCPYCERCFGSKAFERHTEWCKEQKSRVRAQSESRQEAKERLQARTKYRAPLNKTQRALTKEHYSPMRVRRDSSPHISCTSLDSKRKSPDLPKDLLRQSPSSFSRNATLRNSSRLSSSAKNAGVSSQRSFGMKTNSLPNSKDEKLLNENEDTIKPKVINRGNISEKSLTRKTPVENSSIDSSQQEFGETSRFCHECGARYPVAAAKFCCQCGIRRITI